MLTDSDRIKMLFFFLMKRHWKICIFNVSVTVLINSRFDRRSIKLVLVDNDRTKLDQNAIIRRIKSVVIHENFHSYTYNNDIAIIEMDRTVNVNGIVRTACLPEDSKYTSVVGFNKSCNSQTNDLYWIEKYTKMKYNIQIEITFLPVK